MEAGAATGKGSGLSPLGCNRCPSANPKPTAAINPNPISPGILESGEFLDGSMRLPSPKSLRRESRKKRMSEVLSAYP